MGHGPVSELAGQRVSWLAKNGGLRFVASHPFDKIVEWMGHGSFLPHWEFLIEVREIPGLKFQTWGTQFLI
jgi:hypothetical protein